MNILLNKQRLIVLGISTMAILYAPQPTYAKQLAFADKDAIPQWAIVNDSVMGGRSNSRIEDLGSAHRFSGSVSLENNGGFASIRYRVARTPPDANRVQLRVKGDGKQYQLRFRTSDSWRAIAYSTRFQTIKNEWQTFEFLTEDFRPEWRGRRVTGAPELSTQAIKQIGVFIGDKQVQSFEIDLQSISFLNDTADAQ